MMKRMLRIGLLAVVVFIMCSGVAFAYDGHEYTSNEALANKLSDVLNGKVKLFSNSDSTFAVGDTMPDKKYFWANGKDSGKQCYAYANAVYTYLFGESLGYCNGNYQYSKRIGALSGKSQVGYQDFSDNEIATGACIRTTGIPNTASDNGHSMIVLTYDENSITILDCNRVAKNKIDKVTWSWSEFNENQLTNRGRTIYGVVQPNETKGDLSYKKLICYERCTYKVIKSFTFKKDMYSSAEAVGSAVKVDTYISSAEVWRNKYDNMWIKTTDGKWVYAGWKYENGSWVQSGDQYLQFYSDNNEVAWNDNNVSGKTLAKASYTLTGNITSDATMITVKGQFHKGASCWGASTREFGASNKSYSVMNSELDRALSFASLPVSDDMGLQITVKYMCNRGFDVATKDTPIYRFKVSENGSSTPTGDVYKVLSTTTQGLNVRSSAGTSGAIIGLLSPNQTITVTKTATADGYTWGYGVTSNGLTGWVVISRTDWIQKVSSSSVPVTGVTVVPYYTEYDEVIYIDKEVVLEATVYPSDATDKGVTWSSSNTSVAAVGATNGLQATIVGKGKGSAVITCKTNDGGYTCTVTINVLKDVTGVQLLPKTLTMNVGSTYKMSANVLPTDASNQTIHWYTSDNTIVQADDYSAGTITAVKVGTATITAMAERGGYTASSTVTVVQPVTDISLSSASTTLNVGDSKTITATVSPSNASNKNVTWTSSNASVATVSNGTVKAVSPGTATITCTAADGSGKTAKCTVTVNAVKHELDVNGWLDGEISGNVTDYGTFDVYINGSLVNDDVSDYCTQHPVGTTYEIRDIKALAGHQYNGVYSGALKGTISDSSVKVFLSFSTTYTVSFNANGGTGAPAAQTKVKNTALTLSSTKPTRSGYTFMGWATSSAATAAQYQPGGSYTDNAGVTLYAVWQRDKIYVTQISLSQTELTLEKGDAQTLTATVLPDNADNPAVAWTTSNESVATVSNGTVTAVGPGTAKIVCSATDGSGVSAVCTVTVNEAHSHTIAMDRPILATKTENGLSIGFRCRTCNEIILPQKSVGSDRILALPNALKTIDDEAFAGADMQQIVIPDGTTRIGSRAFAGCGELLLVSIPKDVNSIADDAFEGCDTQYFCIVAEDGSYAAQYAETNGLYHCDPKGRFTVTLDARGGKCGTEGFTAEVGKPLGTLPVPTRNGYSFDGWYDEGDSPVNEDTVVNDSIGSLTLHAKWYSVITFNANGGSCNTASMNVYEGQAIGTLPAASRENYTFNGWYTAASGGVKAEATTEFDGATTLYAQWTRKTCTITYNANGGVCTTGSRTLNCGDAIGTLPVPTRDYYTFSGWYTAASGGTKITTTATFTSSATLYAQWTANAYSGWVTESSVPSNARIVDSKTQYQYRDTTYTTVYSDWSGWSDWTITRESTSDLKKEESATVYGWYWFQCPNCGRHWHVYSGLAIDCSKTWGPGDGCGGDNIQSTDHHIVWSTTPWSSGTSNWYGTGRTCLDTGAYTRMFAWTDGGSARTGYRYATRTSSQKANVGAWSAWSDTVYTASSTREVATRKLVRYQLK